MGSSGHTTNGRASGGFNTGFGGGEAAQGSAGKVSAQGGSFMSGQAGGQAAVSRARAVSASGSAQGSAATSGSIQH
jgi:hypothetical protein